jgi:hypothetical protein
LHKSGPRLSPRRSVLKALQLLQNFSLLSKPGRSLRATTAAAPGASFLIYLQVVWLEQMAIAKQVPTTVKTRAYNRRAAPFTTIRFFTGKLVEKRGHAKVARRSSWKRSRRQRDYLK